MIDPELDPGNGNPSLRFLHAAQRLARLIELRAPGVILANEVGMVVRAAMEAIGHDEVKTAVLHFMRE